VVRADGSVRETFTVRWVEPDGRKPRRSFDSMEDALDFSAKRRSAKRWRPEELRQEQGGRQTLGEFFAEWWASHAMVELKRATLSTYRCLWEKHAEPRLGVMALRDIDARRVVVFRGELLASGAGRHSIVKTMAMLQRVFRDAVEYGEVAFNPFKAVRKPALEPSREAQPLTPLRRRPTGSPSATNARTSPQPWPGVTYVPTHERPITRDICPGVRHVPLR
jgi:hypothetical protein